MTNLKCKYCKWETESANKYSIDGKVVCWHCYRKLEGLYNLIDTESVSVRYEKSKAYWQKKIESILK